MSRSKTAEEVREELLEAMRGVSSYWSSIPGASAKEMCEGVVFSILNIFDGTSTMPAFDLLVSPHEDDKQWHIGEGEDWYEPKMMINECMMHEEYYT